MAGEVIGQCFIQYLSISSYDGNSPSALCFLSSFKVSLETSIYVLASFLGSGYIGIIYFPALVVSKATSGKVPFMGAYSAGVVVYIIAMIAIFAISMRDKQ